MSGCASDQADKSSGLTDKDRVAGMARQVAADRDASPTVRKIAQDALARGKDDQTVADFEKGQ